MLDSRAMWLGASIMGAGIMVGYALSWVRRRSGLSTPTPPKPGPERYRDKYDIAPWLVGW
jgi:hypothetical protein